MIMTRDKYFEWVHGKDTSNTVLRSLGTWKKEEAWVLKYSPVPRLTRLFLPCTEVLLAPTIVNLVSTSFHFLTLSMFTVA